MTSIKLLIPGTQPHAPRDYRLLPVFVLALRLSSFGVAAVLLELVPIASILFAFTNTVGAALWAADIEKGNVDKEGTAPELREKATKAE